MRSSLPSLAVAAFLLASLPATASALSSPSQTVSSPGGALVLDRRHLVAYVADADNSALHRVDLSSGDVVTTTLECAPQEIVPVDDGILAVSLRGCGKVAFVAMSASGEGSVEATMDVAAEPWGLALSPAGTLLVTSAWGHRLTGIDIATLQARFSMDLPREPRGVTLSPDGRRAFVTHAVGDSISVVDLAPTTGAEGPTVRAVKALGGHHRNRVEKAAGAGTTHPTAALAYTAVWNEAGTRLFVPHVLAQNGRDTTHVVAGGYGGVSVQEDTSVADVAVLAGATEQPLAGPGAGRRRGWRPFTRTSWARRGWRRRARRPGRRAPPRSWERPCS